MSPEFTYFDTHTHKKYNDAEVLFVRNAFHHFSYTQLSNLNYYFSVGIHPWDVHENYNNSIDHLKEIAKHPNCKAIGECGLDYFIKTNRELQKEIFQLHINLAEEINKPLIIHCVRAYHDLIPILKNVRVPVILHQFIGSEEIVKSLLLDHVYFSFGKQLMRSDMQSTILESIPLDHLLLETDNNDIHIEEIYWRASTALDMEFETLRNQVNTNAQKIFF